MQVNYNVIYLLIGSRIFFITLDEYSRALDLMLLYFNRRQVCEKFNFEKSADL